MPAADLPGKIRAKVLIVCKLREKFIELGQRLQRMLPHIQMMIPALHQIVHDPHLRHDLEQYPVTVHGLDDRRRAGACEDLEQFLAHALRR